MKRNLVLLSLCFLIGTGLAFSQAVQFDVKSANPDVATTGRAEVLGQVTLTGAAVCGFPANGTCTSVAGTIQVTYAGVQIDNAIATANLGLQPTNGIEICEQIAPALVQTCNATGTYLTTVTSPFTVTNSNTTPSNGIVSFSVKGLVKIGAGDQIVIRGVRGRIDESSALAPNTQIFAGLGTSPSTVASFFPLNPLVATSRVPLSISVKNGSILQCITGGAASITVKEGFNIAFVDEREPFPPPANPRPLFVGADGRTASNSQVHFLLTTVPSGVTITWPAASSADPTTGAVLVLLPGSTTSSAVYEFRTPNQALSDNTSETFTVTLTSAANVALSGTNADFGTIHAQGQMYPAVQPLEAGPEVRYNDPLINVPPDALLFIGPCTTNLLFPWMAFIPSANYDTGFAIANTSTDPYGTLPQNGVCTLNFYPTNDTTLNTKPTANPAVVFTTPTIPSGATFATNISNISSLNAADFTGYMIAVCKFQYGHGFGFITNTIGTPSALAQGYVALIIPDPNVLPTKSRSAAIGGVDKVLPVIYPPYGEGLAE